MPKNNKIKTISLYVSLSPQPYFYLRADEQADKAPTGCIFGADPKDKDAAFLKQILDEINVAYAAKTPATLNVQGFRIKPTKP